jgi:hypothetical protein
LGSRAVLMKAKKIIVQHGHDKSLLLIFLLLYEHTPNNLLTDQNIITIKEDVYSVLHLGMKMKFREEKYSIEIVSTLI